jgi:(2Fe-2S) ferredoxin
MNTPHYQFHVFCCINEREAGAKRGCCASKGADALQKYMKVRAKELGIEMTRINRAGCLDQCEQGPVIVVYPEGTWYRAPDTAAIDSILTEHLQGGNVVQDLLIITDTITRSKT